jgi:hypothetical protein
VNWHFVASSEDVGPGVIVSVALDGEEIVLWRSRSGVLSACDARCPHQWAHLGSGGVIDGEELVCLSHFWRFAANGEASKLAMNGRRDNKSSVRTHLVRETNGGIEVAMTTE